MEHLLEYCSYSWLLGGGVESDGIVKEFGMNVLYLK